MCICIQWCSSVQHCVCSSVTAKPLASRLYLVWPQLIATELHHLCTLALTFIHCRMLPTAAVDMQSLSLATLLFMWCSSHVCPGVCAKARHPVSRPPGRPTSPWQALFGYMGSRSQSLDLLHQSLQSRSSQKARDLRSVQQRVCWAGLECIFLYSAAGEWARSCSHCFVCNACLQIYTFFIRRLAPKNINQWSLSRRAVMSLFPHRTFFARQFENSNIKVKRQSCTKCASWVNLIMMASHEQADQSCSLLS